MEKARTTLEPLAKKDFNKDQDQQDLLFFYTGDSVSYYSTVAAVFSAQQYS